MKKLLIGLLALVSFSSFAYATHNYQVKPENNADICVQKKHIGSLTDCYFVKNGDIVGNVETRCLKYDNGILDNGFDRRCIESERCITSSLISNDHLQYSCLSRGTGARINYIKIGTQEQGLNLYAVKGYLEINVDVQE